MDVFIMSILAIADLHLSFGTAGKEMDFFGEEWKDHHEKIEYNWREIIAGDDLVLIAGDISWAMTLEEALPDLEWIDALPGTKVIVKGNHDYWWPSLKKLRQALPSSIHVIHNDAFTFGDIGIAGARLWDCPDFSCASIIAITGSEPQEETDPEQTEKIYARELNRLELSLKALDSATTTRISLIHYPPLAPDLTPSPVTELLEKYNITACVFGHLHSLKKNISPFGTLHNISYHLTSCDYLNFTPLRVI